MNPKDRRVRIHPEELESIFTLKSLIDHNETVCRYIEEYQKLGWVLQAVNLQDGTDLEVDSGEDSGAWVSRLWEPELSESKISLGVRTGKRSRLMVLEVAKGRGESILDRYGAWRARCAAVSGDGREQHFYAWSPSALGDSASCRVTPEIRWFGEGQVAPLPPSFDAETQETWRWLSPPWEEPPQSPGQPLLRFLQQHFTREHVSRPEVSLSWQEVYCLASPFEPLLQALSASYPSMWHYYQGIVEAAVAVGLKAPEVLLSLLWHAPRGKVGQQPEIWGVLQKLVAEVQDRPGTSASPDHVPWEAYPGNFPALEREPAAGSSVQTPDRPGPSCFLQRRLAKPPQAGAAGRTPFSCRPIREDVKKG